MAYPMGEAKPEPLRVDFDCRLKLEFPGSKITSDAGLLAYRELDDVLGLTDLGGAALSDLRRGKNTRHLLTGLLRQSVYGRLAGYEDVNDAERLSLDPAMRAIVDCKGLDRRAASTSQMGRFETEWLATEENFAVLNYLPGAWIDRVHDRKIPKIIILDMDSSVSPTHGGQEGSAYNGHFGCSCYHPLFVFNQFGDLERCALRAGNVHRVRPETLCRITEFSEHESNGRELDEGERVAVEVLPVLGQSAAAVEPGDGAFDHPTPGLDDEALHPIGSLDDLGLEIGQDAGQGAVKDRALIGAVGEQFPEKGKQTEQGRQQRETAVAILNVGGGDDAVQQQALRIDQNMPLLALDQLAGIEAVAVDASPPFSALFTL